MDNRSRDLRKGAGMRRVSHHEAHQHATDLGGRGTLRVVDCKRCGHAAAWAQGKAGKWYLCKVGPKATDPDVLRAASWLPHRCDEYEEA